MIKIQFTGMESAPKTVRNILKINAHVDCKCGHSIIHHRGTVEFTPNNEEKIYVDFRTCRFCGCRGFDV